MAFTNTLKEKIRYKSDHTCCYCKKRENPTDIHHIIPQKDSGPDDEDNAVLLCKNCHDLIGNNPDKRADIRRRRDTWYEDVARMRSFPSVGDIPLLNYSYEAESKPGLPIKGILFTDRDKESKETPPSTYISFYFKTSRFFTDVVLQDEKWLLIEADVLKPLTLRVQVRAYNKRDIISLITFLKTGYTYLSKSKKPMGSQGWSLQGFRPDKSGMGSSPDYFYMWNENQQTHMILSAFGPTNAAISVLARFSPQAKLNLANYLEHTDFVKGISPEELNIPIL